ncbi:hypothetical protein H17ap60334_05434 [Thermosipho africanus H17ap60334]|uniref:hypothetical protein n=1 Tax=Thermosipho africanus TaxID=2421 RepID=UPI00028C716F|nr:hypothetical protein [Thermosipho africanus]EKF49430.1 hypothetical protein H17ap60334_05434 [Thermosipho africanus H17ap60334]
MSKVEIILVSLLITLFLFALNFILDGKVVEITGEYFSVFSKPFFSLKMRFMSSFENKNECKIIVFDETKNGLLPLSYSEKGIYFYSIESSGIILTDDKKILGIARKTGKYIFVKKWWYDNVEVTVVTDDFEVDGFLKAGKLEVFDNVQINNAKIFLSKNTPYGLALIKMGIYLAEIKDGVLKLNLPDIKTKRIYFILNDYIKNNLGGDRDE